MGFAPKHVSVLLVLLTAQACALAPPIDDSGSVAVRGSSGDPITISPDSQATPGASLQPHVARWRVVNVAADGIRADNGIWTDRFVVVETVSTGTVLEFTQEHIGEDGTVLSDHKNVVLYPSFVPVHVDQRNGRIRASIDFDGQVVSGTIEIPGQEPRSFQETLTRPFFDFSIGGYLLLDYEWRAGLAVRARFYSGTIRGEDGTEWITFEVVKAEPLTFQGEMVPTWLVEVPELRWKMWMVPEPPYVYRSVVPRGEGKGVFELIDYEVFR